MPTDALEKLTERLDDIRSSQTTFAVEMARMAGKMEAMEVALQGLQTQLGDVSALRSLVVTLQEKVRAMEAKELRGWIEGIVKAAIGGGFALGAQHFLR